MQRNSDIWSVEYLSTVSSIKVIQDVDCIVSSSNLGIELLPTELICWVVLLIIWGKYEYVKLNFLNSFPVIRKLVRIFYQ
jgi:hypothetical protein